MKISQDRYVDHAALSEYLRTQAKEYPRFITLEKAGESLEGREIWAVTVTDKETGNPEDKPAMYIDACIHAGEVTGTQVCLHLIRTLLDGAERDPFIGRLLKTRTFYILPRTNPDGAEYFLHTEFESWGNMRPFPSGADENGLTRCDVDNNGLLLLMRKRDPNGEWKISSKDPRLMIPREAWEYGGEYYSIYPEGILQGDEVDPEDFKVLPRRYQLNMNRNYPDGWNIRTAVAEGGEYPLSEPESAAVAKFLLTHKNIGTLQDLHTNAGVVLCPYSYQDDSHIPAFDREIIRQFAEMAKSETGYDTVGTYEAFATPGEPPRRGCLDDWTYDSLGILSFGTELWNLAAKAGIGYENENYYPDQYRPEEDELKMLHWNDRYLGGRHFINWTPFRHPQLGNLEIGGWNWKFTSKNPPVEYLGEECERVTGMLLKQANFLPELQKKAVRIEPFSETIFRLSVTVENAGFLPTFIVEKALENSVAKPVTASIRADGPFELLQGGQIQELGHLEGRLRRDRAFYFGDPTEGIPHKTATASWIVRADPDTVFTVKIESEKAGRLEIRLSGIQEEEG